MATLPLDKPAGVLVKTTCVDFPGIVAGSFFLKGCNLRCPYCYNTGLVIETDQSEKLNTVQELFDHMEKRQGILSGIVISGGEPLINPYTPLIIKKARELNYKVKLDTNGTLPDELEVFLNDKELRPDFVAMDYKTSPARYASTMCPAFSNLFGNTEFFEKKVLKCIELVSSLPQEAREWRTVMVPGLITKEDLKIMASYLPQDASWQFAQFMNGNCIDRTYNTLTPYTDDELKELITYAKTFITGAELR